MFKVYELSKENRNIIDKLMADDVIGRQSITYKDGTNYGYDSKFLLIIEGSPDIFTRVNDLKETELKELPEKKADEVYKKVKNEENNSQDGMGFLFG